MITGLFYAHSGLRYLVLLAGVVAVAFYLHARTTNRPIDRPARVVGSVYVGLLHLQVLLGLVMAALGLFYGALIGHIVLMLLAVAAAQGSGILARGTTDVSRYHGLRLAGVIASLLLIVAGVSAIGRSVFASGAPSITG